VSENFDRTLNGQNGDNLPDNEAEALGSQADFIDLNRFEGILGILSRRPNTGTREYAADFIWIIINKPSG